MQVSGKYRAALPSFAAPPDGALTRKMLDAYQEAGVLILEDFVPAKSCLMLKERALELVEAFDPDDVRSVFSSTKQTQANDTYFIESGDRIRFFLEDESFDESGKLKRAKGNCLNKMGHAMHDLDPVFDKFSRTRELAEVTRRIGVVEPVIIQSMYIFKPPHIGGEVVWHQDSTYLYTEPESCLGFWVALDEATIDNGCLYFIPGQHGSPLKRRHYRAGNDTLTTRVLDNEPWPEYLKLPAEAAVGTLVVFHGRAPHMSCPNRSAESRHAYSLHVIERNCHYPVDNWLQRRPDLPLRGFA